MNRMTISDVIFDILNAIVMIFLIVICVYPLLYVVFASLSDPIKLMQYNGGLWKPVGFSLSSYIEVFKSPMIFITYKNTLIYLVIGTFISSVLTILGAYVLSRKRKIYVKSLLNILVIITMFFAGGLIPTYLTVKSYGLLDTMWAVILPTAMSTWNLIVMRTSFAALPSSLEEAAKIDGANDLEILWNVVLPLSKPIIAVIVLFYGVGIWNSWFTASIYLKNRDLFPLQLYLREILINSNTDAMMSNNNISNATDRFAIGETIKYSTIVVATLPILVAYPFLQKYFVKGVMVGAIKG